MNTVIVDVDGTIALKGDRNPFHYHLAAEDAPNLPVLRIVQCLLSMGHAIVFFSGRENVNFETNPEFADAGLKGTCHDLTVDWIRKHLFIHEVRLYMRAEGDHRKDSDVKRELFEQHLAGKKILCAIDDRDQVVRMWRDELGITCLQVADGDF